MNVDEEAEKIDKLLLEAARRYRRAFADPEPYSTGTNGFVIAAESAWFRAKRLDT